MEMLAKSEIKLLINKAYENRKKIFKMMKNGTAHLVKCKNPPAFRLCEKYK